MQKRDDFDSILLAKICYANECPEASDILAIIASGANPNARQRQFANFTPLHWCVANGFAALIAPLVKAGADVEGTSSPAAAPLIQAAIMQQNAAAQALLARHANVNVICGEFTPLVIATTGNQAEMVRILLRHGADIHLHMPDGKSAFDIAREQNHPQILPLFHAAAADLNRDKIRQEARSGLPLTQKVTIRPALAKFRRA